MNILGKVKRVALLMALAASFSTGLNAAEATTPEQMSYSIANYVAMQNTSLDFENAKNIADGITYYSSMYGVDPLLMTALLQTESNFNQDSVSSAGAIGIGQIMPSTAVSLGVNPYDTMQNIQGACSYISTALKNFADWPYPTEVALAAYNAGSNAVITYGGIPPYAETQNYVVKIRDRYANLKSMIEGTTVVDVVEGGSYNAAPSYSPNGNGIGYIEYVEQDIPVGDILDAEDD